MKQMRAVEAALEILAETPDWVEQTDDDQGERARSQGNENGSAGGAERNEKPRIGPPGNEEWRQRQSDEAPGRERHREVHGVDESYGRASPASAR